jgi:hypothetical protein
MKRTKRYDEGGGIPAQTEEEAANEMELNSPAARARRNISDAENQIRADAAAKLASKVAPVMEMDNAPEMGTEGKRTSMAVGPAAKRTPMVTKEQLAASGLSLRDYLNKQQGLTRRGDSEKSTRMPARPGQEAPIYSNEGRNNPRKPGMYSGTIKDIKDVFKKNPNKKSFFEANDERIAALKSGGSVSSASKRADGIAVRGKTKGKMC